MSEPKRRTKEELEKSAEEIYERYFRPRPYVATELMRVLSAELNVIYADDIFRRHFQHLPNEDSMEIERLLFSKINHAIPSSQENQESSLHNP